MSLATCAARSSSRRSIFRLAASLVFGILLYPGTAATEPAASESFAAYGRMLARHVQAGEVSGIRTNLVDYAALAEDADYRQAIAALAAAAPERLEGDAARIAFWTNAYNLLAIKAVVDRYPVESIRDGGNFFFPIWKKEVGEVGGRQMTLDQIEHGILRKDFREPRVHMALVCASLSCPNLRREVYRADRLDEQLDDQAARFLADPTKGLRPEDSSRAEVSSIFRWFGGDFEDSGGVAAWILAHAPADVRGRVPQLEDRGLSWLDYDWSLNDAARARGER